MGTDIHMHVDRRQDPKVADLALITRLAISGIAREIREWETLDYEEFDDRHYVTFAVLAGVRNKYKFTDGQSLKPIAERRGLPTGLSEDENVARKIAMNWYHSHSWLLLSEVLAYDWDQEILRTGVVPLRNVDLFRTGVKPLMDVDSSHNQNFESFETMRCERRSVPRNYSQRVCGDRIVTVDPALGAYILDKGVAAAMSSIRHYVALEWRSPLSTECAGFLAWARSLTKFGDPADIRLVFAFDS